MARVVAEDLESDKLQVITGVNLAMILQILSVREANDPTGEELTKAGLDGIADLKAVLKANM
jgi:mannose/fructose-specific phosphotransferase system component IIA